MYNCTVNNLIKRIDIVITQFQNYYAVSETYCLTNTGMLSIINCIFPQTIQLNQG